MQAVRTLLLAQGLLTQYLQGLVVGQRLLGELRIQSLPSRFHRHGLLVFNLQTGHPFLQFQQPGLCDRLPGLAGWAFLRSSFEHRPGGDQAVGLLLPPRLFLPRGGQRRFEQTSRVLGLLAQGANFVLPQQVGQQGLDLCMAVGTELSFALGTKH